MEIIPKGKLCFLQKVNSMQIKSFRLLQGPLDTAVIKRLNILSVIIKENCRWGILNYKSLLNYCCFYKYFPKTLNLNKPDYTIQRYVTQPMSFHCPLLQFNNITDLSQMLLNNE